MMIIDLACSDSEAIPAARRFATNRCPVKPGEVIILYGTGFGSTDPPVPSGQVFTGAAPTADPVVATIGGVDAKVQFAGISSSGLYQLNVVVPTWGTVIKRSSRRWVA